MSSLLDRLRQSVGARPGEGDVLLASAAYYFLVLCAYYVLRPIRDDMGAAGGIENLAWLFTGTMVAMLSVHPMYTALVSKLPRRKFIGLAYRFFIANLVIFFAIFKLVDPAQAIWVGRVFYIWTSVFNLFVVSVFWSMLADVFQPGQGKRLFGVVAVGGTIGAIFGSSITTALAKPLGSINLLLVSAAILELAVQASRFLDRREQAMRVADADSAAAAVVKNAEPSAREQVIGGGVLDGIRHVFSSPYLLGIAFLVFFYTISSTFLYFQSLDVVTGVFGSDRAARTQFLGTRDLAVNIITLVMQLFVTGRLIRTLGVGFGLAFLPVVTMVGFGALSIWPTLTAVLVFEVVRRAGNFAIQRPAREALFTVVPRSAKYKAKNFSDTTVYRFGDQVGAWSYSWMAALGLAVTSLSMTMVPLSAVWLLVTIFLGRKYTERERQRQQDEAAVAS